jgi:GR25 family glycosyltransferase involved in LPS biosynthesis
MTLRRSLLIVPFLLMGSMWWYGWTDIFATTTEESLKTIDQIYIINLDRSPDRYQRISKQLNELNLPIPYERFKAVDGKTVRLVNHDTGDSLYGADLLTNTKPLNGVFHIECSPHDRGDDVPTAYKNVTFCHDRQPGEMGCACSHLKVWKDMVKRGFKRVLILEDDAEFSSLFKKRLALALDDWPKDADVVFLGLSAWNHKHATIPHTTWIRKIKQPFGGLYGYVLTSKGARKLVENYRSYDRQIDDFTAGAIQNKRMIGYVAQRRLITHARGGESTIG